MFIDRGGEASVYECEPQMDKATEGGGSSEGGHVPFGVVNTEKCWVLEWMTVAEFVNLVEECDEV